LISKQIKKTVLQSILQSHEFSGSKNSRELLKYLVNASIAGKSPSETTIALELFGRDKNFNPNEDPIIRVNVHNLRKKLESYYRYEGVAEKIRIEIPKGHYEARFVPVSEKLNIISPQKYNIGIIILCVIAVIQVFLFIGLWKEKRGLAEVKKNKCHPDYSHLFWADSLRNDLPFLIVIGDFFFFQEYHTDLQKWQIVRDKTINSFNDYDQFRINNPNLKLKLSEYSYFPSTYMNEIIYLSDIIQSISDKRINYCCASHLQMYNLEEQNIVFIGNVNTLGTINRFFSEPYFTIDEFNNAVSAPPLNEETVKIYTALSEPRRKYKDYAIIKKIKGANKNNILIITSFHQSGLINAIKFFRRQTTIKVLKDSMNKKFNKIPSDFAILLKVDGCDKKGYDVEIQEMMIFHSPLAFQINNF